MDLKTTVILMVLFGLGFFLYMMLPSGTVHLAECHYDEDCELSLCDCKCYKENETPEATSGLICGKNCLDWYNVSGCKCEDNRCVELIK